MQTIEEIQEAIKSLPRKEYRQLMLWFAEHDWQQWDREIEVDSANGKLDGLAAQAENAKSDGTLKDL